MEVLIAIITGYFIGSIPTAFIILKISRGLDIRKEGSGNVGTLNSYEVTNSKIIGVVVLIIDALKGLLSVVIINYLFNDQFVYTMISLLSAVFGHCYSIWLKFKGGRGLATFGGGTLVISPIINAIWGISWLILYKGKKDIHFANIGASIAVILSVIFFADLLNKLSFPSAKESIIFSFYLSLLMLIILSKHWEPFKVLIKNKQSNLK
jgi:glycerol-3-phosphate acyltransferase PlsY